MVERLNGIQEVRSSILLGSTYKFENWNRSSVWLERLPVTQEVASSSLVTPAMNAQIAQSVEQGTENPRVGGSIPPLGTILLWRYSLVG